jgi:glyoxylase-like metal-dependent hydrolase (beta-lactamase superfamily II)/rhodanese-related sulfurtransferase
VSSSTQAVSIEASELARRLAAGERVTVLDVRPDAEEAVAGEGVTTKRVDPESALADPRGLARELEGPVVVACNRGIKAQPVAAALREAGADALVLAGGLRAWLATLQARPVELGLPGLELRQIQRPGRGCLSYLLAGDGRALVVDPAPEVDFYPAQARELGVEIGWVFDTHLHADHISGARALADATGAELLLPAASLERGVAYAERVTPVEDGWRLELGGHELRALALPGHTTDMTGLLVGGRALISGDSLFADGIARPDLQRRDHEGARAMARTLHRTLHERVLSLPAQTVLLPGHARPGVRSQAVAPSLAEVRRALPELDLDADAFAAAVAEDLPPRPANFVQVIEVNSGLRPADPELEQGGNSCATR